MYLPAHFAETRTAVLHTLIRRHPLATFITRNDGEITVNHFPLLLASEGGELGLLQGHIPRVNPIWQDFGDASAVVLFRGPECYVTPSWYPSKREHGRVVPTWNYVVAEARGRPVAVHESDWLRRHLNALTSQQEAAEAAPWQLSDAPAAFTERMIQSLVGIELAVTSLVGKWKVSQNRPAADRSGVAAGLRARGGDGALAMARLVLEYGAAEPEQ